MKQTGLPLDLSTIDDMADRFNVTRETVLRWNSIGTGPRRIQIGRRVYYREADIQHWIESQESK